jgi:hypothetical protein
LAQKAGEPAELNNGANSNLANGIETASFTQKHIYDGVKKNRHAGQMSQPKKEKL